MIGTTWKLPDSDVNPWLYVVMSSLGANAWILLEITTGTVVHASKKRDELKLIPPGYDHKGGWPTLCKFVP